MSVVLSVRQMWGMPIILAVVSVFGLASALLGDGIWDALSWIALGFPVGIIVWHAARSVHPKSPRNGLGLKRRNLLQP